eukprot:6457766-Ditylum_brightwellii.AAC.1
MVRNPTKLGVRASGDYIIEHGHVNVKASVWHKHGLCEGFNHHTTSYPLPQLGHHSVLASMPPFSDMRKEQVGRQFRTIDYWNCLINGKVNRLGNEGWDEADEELGCLKIDRQKDVSFIESGVKHTIIEGTWAFKVKRTPDRTAKKRKDIADTEDAIQHMMDAGFQLRVEDYAAGFLGIELDQQDDGSIKLKQTDYGGVKTLKTL